MSPNSLLRIFVSHTIDHRRGLCLDGFCGETEKLHREAVELHVRSSRFDYSSSLSQSLNLPGHSAIFIRRRNIARVLFFSNCTAAKSRFFLSLSRSFSFVYLFLISLCIRRATLPYLGYTLYKINVISARLVYTERPASVHPKAVSRQGYNRRL